MKLHTDAPHQTRAELIDLWGQCLASDGFTDPEDAVLHELALYFHITPEEARERCEHWVEYGAAEWQARPRDTREGLLDFYQTQQSWIFDTMWYHAKQYSGRVLPESVLIAERFNTQRGGMHLDFGAGPGSTSIFFHRLGCNVALADVSTTMQAFAQWRLARRSIPAQFFDTSKDELPEETFDLITACDVMVHVPDPRETFARLHRALKVGGHLVFNVDARVRVSAETHGFLYRFAYPILRPVRATGFDREPRLEIFHVYRKISPRSMPQHVAVLTFDACRYNLGVALAGLGLRGLRSAIDRNK